MSPFPPPYADWLGVVVDRHADGTLRFVLPYAPRVGGRPGFVHGGAIGGLLEIAAYATLRDALVDPASTLKPVTVTVDFMRGARDRDTHAGARIVRLGRRIANVEATAWQDDPARPVAAARMTLSIRGTTREEDR